jgi:hypothetical protein
MRLTLLRFAHLHTAVGVSDGMEVRKTSASIGEPAVPHVAEDRRRTGVAASPQRPIDPPHDVTRPTKVLGRHDDDTPTQCFESLAARKIPVPLTRIVDVMPSVVFDEYAIAQVGEIGAPDEVVLVAQRDIRRGLGQASEDDHQPQQGLARRLHSVTGEQQRPSSPPDTVVVDGVDEALQALEGSLSPVDEPVGGDHPVRQRQTARRFDQRLGWRRQGQASARRTERGVPAPMDDNAVQPYLMRMCGREVQSPVGSDVEAVQPQRGHPGRDRIGRQDEKGSSNSYVQGQRELGADVHLAVQPAKSAALQYSQGQPGSERLGKRERSPMEVVRCGHVWSMGWPGGQNGSSTDQSEVLRTYIPPPASRTVWMCAKPGSPGPQP